MSYKFFIIQNIDYIKIFIDGFMKYIGLYQKIW